jgi:hypothetical protein
MQIKRVGIASKVTNKEVFLAVFGQNYECVGGWGTMFARRAKLLAERNTFAPIFAYDK